MSDVDASTETVGARSAFGARGIHYELIEPIPRPRTGAAGPDRWGSRWICAPSRGDDFDTRRGAGAVRAMSADTTRTARARRARCISAVMWIVATGSRRGDGPAVRRPRRRQDQWRRQQPACTGVGQRPADAVDRLQIPDHRAAPSRFSGSRALMHEAGGGSKPPGCPSPTNVASPVLVRSVSSVGPAGPLAAAGRHDQVAAGHA